VGKHRVYREYLRDIESAGMSSTTSTEISTAFRAPSATVKAQS